jgi:hypothetical protein
MATLSLPIEARADCLTAALRRSGALASGHVSDVVVESSRATILSRIIRLRLAYQGPDAGPASVIIKTNNPDRADVGSRSGRNEIAFYRDVASRMRAPLTPRCFDANWDPSANAWWLLLEDLTDSHCIATTWPLPPTREQCTRLIRARARFHAAWWDDAGLGTSVGTWSSPEDSKSGIEEFAKLLGRFFDRAGDRVSRDRRRLFELLLEAAPRLSARYHSHHDITVVQGDAHFWNAFLPRESGGEDVRLFDWDSWSLDLGSDDLAYAMAMHWYPERRGEMEEDLLDAYHAELVANGVQGYDRNALRQDYRLSALCQIKIPVWQETYNIPTVIWWNNLERAFLAVDDLGCRELLQP